MVPNNVPATGRTKGVSKWDRRATSLDDCPVQEDRKAALDYTEQQVPDWSDHYRITPRRWREQLVEQTEPRL